MKRIIILLSAFLVCSSMTGQLPGKPKVHSLDPFHPDNAPGKILVKFRENVSIDGAKLKTAHSTGIRSLDSILNRFSLRTGEAVFSNVTGRLSGQPGGLEGKDSQRLSGIFKLSFPEDVNIRTILETLKHDSLVEFAEPDFYVYTMLTEPNDALFQSGEQWYLDEVRAPFAWDSITGDSSQVIGVIDTGTDWHHPDLDGNIQINQNEIPGNGIDDDNNGFIDDVRGWDFINHDNDPADDNGHGTHVSGVIAAETDNYIGIAGIAWHSKILPIKVLSGSGQGSMSTLAAGVVYAADNGATVINMSLGSYGESQTLKAALVYANEKSTLVAAAGNDHYKVDTVSPPSDPYAPLFPACYPFIIGVEASMPGGELAPFSNFDPSGFKYTANPWGLNYEIRAPGTNIYSTFPNGSYMALSGTSMATPIVSGAVALLKNFRNGITNEEILARIVQYSQNKILKIPNLLNGVLGSDLLYISNTLIDSLQGDDNDRCPDAGETIDLFFTVKNAGGRADSVWAAIEPAFPGDTMLVTIIKDRSSIGDLDSATYNNGIPAYTTLTGERDPFRIRFSRGIENDRVVGFNYQIGSKQQGSAMGTFYLTIQNGTELYGVLDTTFTIAPGRLWLVNRSFKITETGTLNISPGTHLKINNSMINHGVINAIGLPDSLIIIEGPGGFHGAGAAGGPITFSHVKIIQAGCMFSDQLIIADHCLAENFTCDLFSNCQLRLNDCIFRNGNNVSSWSYGPIERCIVDNCVGGFGAGGHTYRLNNFSNGAEFPVGHPTGPNNITSQAGRILYRSPDGLVYDTLIRRQYWGTTDSVSITDFIFDFWDSPERPLALFQPILNRPTELAHGIVWKILINGKNPQDEMLDPIGCETVRFDVCFNRPMDISKTPWLSFGIRSPYTQRIVVQSPSWNADSTVWTAWYEVGLETGDGINTLRADQAYDPEGFKIPLENNERFRFNIQAAASASSEFTATPGIGKVFLSWPFSYTGDFLGFNLYRSTMINDSVMTPLVLINDQLITDSTYVDFQVIPDSTYFYCYTTVGTDLTETGYSKQVRARPLSSANGDANGDLEVNVLDVSTIVRYILGMNPQPFLLEAADLNYDDSINILDIVLLIRVILDRDSKSVFVLESGNNIIAFPGKNDSEVILRTAGEIAALQFEMDGQNLDRIDWSSPCPGFEFSYTKSGTKITGLLYRYDMGTLDAGTYTLVRLSPGNAVIESIKALGSDVNGSCIPIKIERSPAKPEIPSKIRIFPNPARGTTTLSVDSDRQTDISIRLFTAIGEQVGQTEIHRVGKGTHSFTLNPKDSHGELPPGLYYCVVDFISGDYPGQTRIMKKIILLP